MKDKGSGATAYTPVGSTGTRAVARGTYTQAYVLGGNNSTATATGHYAFATTFGSGDTATATYTGTGTNPYGTDATVYGTNSSATANGSDTFALAGGLGGSDLSGNRATATGTGSQAYAGASHDGYETNGNTATAINGGFAAAGGMPLPANLEYNSGNTAIANGTGSQAIAGSENSGDSGYTATAGPGQAVVCPGSATGCS